MKRTLGFTLVVAAVFAACTSDGLGPQSGQLRIEAFIDRTVISPDNDGTLVVRVRNVGPDSIMVASVCRPRPYIYITAPSGTTVRVVGGEGSCVGPPQPLSLAPGGADTTSVVIRACPYTPQIGSARLFGESLPTGAYRAYAQFTYPDYQMVSRRIEFRVRCAQ